MAFEFPKAGEIVIPINRQYPASDTYHLDALVPSDTGFRVGEPPNLFPTDHEVRRTAGIHDAAVPDGGGNSF